MIESRERECLKHGAVVFPLDGVRSQILRVNTIVRTRFVIDDGGVKLFLGGEVPEDHGLRDTGRVCDLLRGCPAETSVREEAYGHRQDLRPALFPGHSGATRRTLNRQLLTQFSPSI